MSRRSNAALRRIDFERSASVFAALGDETRLKLASMLCTGDRSIAELTAGTDITRQGVTKHLSVLAKAGLVRDVWSGRERRWQLEPERLLDARRSLELIEQQWDAALMRLKRAVEQEDV
jgi:DNA-binding transcriptional ArsR family regulator